MATCSIFDKIVINNPKFLEVYVNHMDAVDGSYDLALKLISHSGVQHGKIRKNEYV